MHKHIILCTQAHSENMCIQLAQILIMMVFFFLAGMFKLLFLNVWHWVFVIFAEWVWKMSYHCRLITQLSYLLCDYRVCWCEDKNACYQVWCLVPGWGCWWLVNATHWCLVHKTTLSLYCNLYYTNSKETKANSYCFNGLMTQQPVLLLCAILFSLIG